MQERALRETEAEAAWAGCGLGERLRCVARFRDLLAGAGMEAAVAARPVGMEAGERAMREALTAQVIPLAEAAAFLVREAPGLLRVRRLSWWRQPVWLSGVRTEVRREPLGRVLILAPSNYPLLLPGVQALQALAAGNAVWWKPAPGGEAAAEFMAGLLRAAGLPEGVLRVLGSDPAVVRAALDERVDKVVLTGSAVTGVAVLAELGPRLVPAVMELSGCDACFVREDADVGLAARAVAFGLRLNDGRTCIAPRRLLVNRRVAGAFREALREALDGVAKREVPARLNESVNFEGTTEVYGGMGVDGRRMMPTVLAPEAGGHVLTRSDLFTQIATWEEVETDEDALRLNAACPFALGASVFGRDEGAARALAARIPAGVVVINDVVVPTADARVPFGGRGRSGFGVTRGAEGLLEMTVVKVIQVRRGSGRRHYEDGGGMEAPFFQLYLEAAHRRSLAGRLCAVYHLLRMAMRRQTEKKTTPDHIQDTP